MRFYRARTSSGVVRAMTVTGLIGLAAVLGVPGAAATPSVRLFRSGLTAASAPTRIASARDGSLWFTERATNTIGRITPTGLITEFPVDLAASGPLGIVQGPNDRMFFTETDAGRIGRITPAGAADSTLARNPVAISGPQDIAAGPDGKLWFTEQTGNRIGRVDVFFDQDPPFTLAAGAHPIGIAAGPGGMWFTEFGADKIMAIDGMDAVIEVGTLPSGSGPAGIAQGPDGNMWFTEKTAGKIGRITPGGVVTAFALAGSNSQPESIVSGPDGNLWFTEANASNIGRITPTGTITEFAAGNQPRGITVGADGNLWFTLDGGNAIGRMTTDLAAPLYTDDELIAVPGNSAPSGPADPYPATIQATGLQGTVTGVRVRLNGLSHFNADAVEALLVGPAGQKVLLLADSAGGGVSRDVATGQVITFDDAGPTSPAELVSGIFKPIVPLGANAATAMAAPAPGGPYATTLSAFNGTDPNGTWSLFVQTDSNASQGTIARGWSLDIQTTGPPPVQVPGPTVTVAVPGPVVTVPGPTTTVTGPTTTVVGPPVADVTKPTLTLGTLKTRMPLATFRKGVNVAVTPSEPVTLDVELSVTPRRAKIAAVDAFVLFERTVTAAGATTLAIKPSLRSLGRPKKAFRALLRIVASDKAGNRTTLTKAITVTPGKKRRRA